MAKNLNHTTLEKSKAAKPGRRRELFDVQAPGLNIRITDSGHKSFYWRGRIAGQVQPIRVLIGDCRLTAIDEAREKARGYAKTAAKGEDPRIAIKTEEEAKAQERAAKFELVAEDFIKAEVSKLARPKAVEALIRRYLVSAWRGKPIAQITPAEIAATIDAIVQTGKVHTARQTWAYCQSLFGWASGLRHVAKTGLQKNPCASIKPSDIGLADKPEARQIALSDDQLRIVWTAAGTLPDPWGVFTRFLILSGQRRSEVGNMEWREVDLDAKEWVIAAERMKGKPGKRRAHLVPLTPDMLAILEQIKAAQPEGAKFVFSTTEGRAPITAFSDAKTALDKAVAELVVDGKPLPDWRFHDVRRTVRTGFGAMEKEVLPSVAERVLAHVQGGIEGVYNVHQYEAEKREALVKWNARVARIINPPVGDNVVTMRAAQ